VEGNSLSGRKEKKKLAITLSNLEERKWMGI
jgi:hypothetical protein